MIGKGYIKYSINDKNCKIKISKNFKNNKEILVKFKKENDLSWNYHAPTVVFKNAYEVIGYILSNLENSNMIFSIKSTIKSIQTK